MALGKCAENVLKQLPTEGLNAIKNLISTAKNGLTTLKTSKQAMSANLDISLVPLQLKKTALEEGISIIRKGTNIIPQDLILQCPDIGAVNTIIEKAISSPLEALTNMVFDINRLLAQKSSTNAEIAQIDDATKFLSDLEDAVDKVLNA